MAHTRLGAVIFEASKPFGQDARGRMASGSGGGERGREFQEQLDMSGYLVSVYVLEKEWHA